MSSSVRTIGDLLAHLERTFPLEWAEPWDRVGLIVGDVHESLTGVFVTLDATAEAVARAATAGANLLVAHHPPYLEVPERLVRGPGPDGCVDAAVRAGVAVAAFHTNLDRAPQGAAALPTALGFTIGGALESAPEAVDLVVTYAPADAADRVREAMAAAGAGRVGSYRNCSFSSEGTGRFEPLRGAAPALLAGDDGIAETRIEMLSHPRLTSRVLSAARDAHPYEEPVVLATASLRARGVARLGRVCTWRNDATVQDLADHVATTLGVRCRVWGDPDMRVERIGVANGSAGSLLADARRTCDALVAGEVRYHDALAAVADGLAVIEAGHDVTEWPLVSALADAVREGAAPARVTLDEPSRSWWITEDAHVGR